MNLLLFSRDYFKQSRLQVSTLAIYLSSLYWSVLNTFRLNLALPVLCSEGSVTYLSLSYEVP